MRVPLICLAVLVTVLLALPETKGAPTKPDVTYSREEDKSKKVAKEGEENEQSFETASNSNGLVSGARGYSKDKRNSELEEEQSSSSEVLKTDTGLKKTKKTKKQKKVVTSSEHKTVLVYYMVSYKKLPAQKSGESRVDYYKRVFPVEDNLKQFYHKIFKNYEGEESKVYIERVEFILNNVYADYDPRLDVKWLEEFDHYYTLKYSRKVDECDDSYFPRVLAKESGESTEHYNKRMECLVAALDEEDFSHITFDNSELGYKIGVRTHKATSVSGGSSETGQVNSEVNSSTRRSKEEEESVDESETEIERKGTLSAHKKDIKKKRTTVEKEIKSKTSTFRMAYNKLPTRTEGQSLLDYYKNYFGEITLSELSDEAKSELYLRLLIQYRGESVEDYIKRVDYLFDEVYPDLDIRSESEFANLLTHYYKSKYVRTTSETEEQWCARVLKKQEGETLEHYKERVACLKTAITDIDWSKITIDENSSEGYTLVSRGSSTSSRSIDTSQSEEEIQKTYFQLESEDVATYINRITKKLSEIQSTKEYFDVVKAVYEKYPDLTIWYDDIYFDIVKDYLTTVYEKTSVETEEDYFKRIVLKQSSETDEVYIKRIELLQKLYPTLTLWSDNTYYEKYFKTCYSLVYKQLDSEDETTYFSRIVSKFNEESDFAFITRLTLIRKTYPELPLWYDDKYLNLIEKYYNSLYEKKATETDEAYITRIFTKESYESDECYFKRLEIVQKLFPTLSVWSNDLYYEKYLKDYLQYACKKFSTEDDSSYFSRIISQFQDESDVTYVTRLSLIKRTYPDLALWYDTKYYDLVKKYFTTYYTKKASETEIEYFQRLVTKESCETDEIFVKRIQVLQKLFPTLIIWSDNTFYKYVKQCYEILYKQQDGEDKDSYFSRVVSPLDGESDATYVSRLSLIQRTYRCLPLWYSSNYYEIVKRYYTLKYAQLTGETDEVYVQRLVAKEKGDSTDTIYGSRIHLIHLATVSSSVWYNDKYEEFLKSYYRSYYKKGESDKCAEWLKKVITILDGECENNAVKRIALIKKYTNCNCWTLEILSEIESYFSQSYITTIKETFFTTVTSYSSSTSSSKATSKSEQNEEEFVQVSRG